MRLYIDGSEDNTLSTTRPMDDYTTVPSTQLGDGPGGIPFDGILDGMFVFADTVLTATQISDLYTAGTR